MHESGIDLHPIPFQSETIAFGQNKNAPSELTEGALYQNYSF
jgi:hypothetical protein